MVASFVHFSDLHVDRKQDGKRGPQFSLRVHDMLDHLESIFDFAIEHKVDFVLFGGDMYHTHLPKQEIKSAVHDLVLKLVDAGIPFYGIPGNHDMISRSTSRDALYELTSLRVSGVTIFHEPGVIDCGEYNIVGIPWLYRDFDPGTLKLNGKPSFATVHATILGAVFGSGTNTATIDLGRDFVLDLESLKRFDFVGLGHIHRPQILCESPYIGYPGSVGHQTWGEAKDPDHLFTWYNHGEITHIPIKDRPRYLYELAEGDPVPAAKDPEGFYRFVVPSTYPQLEIERKHKNVYSLDIRVIRERTQRRTAGVPELRGASLKEQLQAYFEFIDEDFSEVETIFEEILDGDE